MLFSCTQQCYIQKRDYGKVKEWLEKAVAIPGETAEVRI